MDMYTAVVVAIIRRSDGRYLVCQRPAGSRYSLKWEFPGGKVEPGELPEAALQRELREELAIDSDVGPLVHEQLNHYPDGGSFAVRYYAINEWSGTIDATTFAEVRWVTAEEFSRLDILDGNRDICSRLYNSEIDLK